MKARFTFDAARIFRVRIYSASRGMRGVDGGVSARREAERRESRAAFSMRDGRKRKLAGTWRRCLRLRLGKGVTRHLCSREAAFIKIHCVAARRERKRASSRILAAAREKERERERTTLEFPYFFKCSIVDARARARSFAKAYGRMRRRMQTPAPKLPRARWKFHRSSPSPQVYGPEVPTKAELLNLLV